MAAIVYSWPQDKALEPYRVEWGLDSPALENVSKITGSVQTADSPFARWYVTMLFNNHSNENQAKREGFFAKISGRANRVNIWRHDRPRPRGTLRGSVVTSADIDQFDKTITINGDVGKTLLTGDMLSVSGQLYMVTDDVTIQGTGQVVNVAARSRKASLSGETVTIERPQGEFILTDTRVMIPTEPRVSPGFSVSFIETFAL